MSVKLLTEHHLEFLSLTGLEASQTRLSLHLSNATLLEITCQGSYHSEIAVFAFTINCLYYKPSTKVQKDLVQFLWTFFIKKYLILKV